MLGVNGVVYLVLHICTYRYGCLHAPFVVVVVVVVVIIWRHVHDVRVPASSLLFSRDSFLSLFAVTPVCTGTRQTLLSFAIGTEEVQY
jgi:hypothetical protein